MCWTVFVVMSVAFLPLGYLIVSIHALPVGARATLGVIVVGGLWWGPFVYAMYLAIAVQRNGDRRLLRRGIAGTAEVLSAKRTNTVIQEGEFAWEAPRVYKYKLRVTLPGRAPYDTDVRICASGISQGSVVNVAASKHNHKRVTIDVGQGSKDYNGVPRPTPVAGAAASSFRGSGAVRIVNDFSATSTLGATSAMNATSQDSEDDRLRMLAQLGQLHSQGVLTDAEFEAQKAKILAE